MSEGRAYEWDEEVDKPIEGGGYTLLEPGEYPFRVVKMERGIFPGNEKTCESKKAILTLEVDGGPQGRTEVRDDIILHSNFQWKAAQFFTATGFRKSGDPIDFKWLRNVIGKTGRVKLKHEKGKDANADKTYNRIDKYVEPGGSPAPAAPQNTDWNPDQFAGSAPTAGNAW